MKQALGTALLREKMDNYVICTWEKQPLMLTRKCGVRVPRPQGLII